MVTDAQTDRTIGVHILGEDVADIINEAVFAVKYKLKIDDLIDTVHVFSTVAESINLAVIAFRKGARPT